MTYGAGGATRSTTVATVTALLELGYDVAPHLSFGADDRTTIETLIRRYQDQGVDRLVALRGDLPSDVDGTHELIHASGWCLWSELQPGITLILRSPPTLKFTRRPKGTTETSISLRKNWMPGPTVR